MKSLWEFALEETDISNLPTDSPARALQRLYEQYSKTCSYDPRDLRIVLGDPCKGVSMPTEKSTYKDFIESR